MEKQQYQCANCGALIPFGLAFCVRCGKQLNLPKQEQMQPPPVNGLTQEQTQHYPSNKKKSLSEFLKFRKGKKANYLRIVGLGLLCAVIVGIGTFLVVKSFSQGTTPPTEEPTPTSEASTDSAAPIIASVNTSPTTATSVIIAWVTNEPATSQIEYGLTTSYGSTTPLDANLVTNHSVTLSGLNAMTTYHFRVKSKDASGNETIDIDRTATTITLTTVDTTPPIISEVSVSGTTLSSITITWKTDEPATSQVEYGLSKSYGSATPLDTNLVTNHSVTLSGLNAMTTYHFVVKSKNASGGETAYMDRMARTISTAVADTTPPVISEVKTSGITRTSVTITWKTDEPATSQVEYGLTWGHGSATPLDTNLVTNHSVTLSGLNAMTTYHFIVKSRDAGANETIDMDRKFRTSTLP